MNGKLRNKWTRRLFPLIALFLLLPWPVAYAGYYNDAHAADGVSAISGGDSVWIEVAEASARPAYTVFGRAIGGVTTPGDLFYINAANNGADIKATLYLTNAQELVNHYSYLILRVGVYVESDGEWQQASGSDGKLISDAIITMRNGQVTFILPGYARYKVTIDGGSFYATNANGDDRSLSPQFYLEVN
jgi:hypothetical protein